MKNIFSLYPITDPDLSLSGDVLSDIENICKGGAKVIQLREKDTSFEEFLRKAKKAREITAFYGVKLIINDNIRIAFFSGADGLHVGQNDLPLPIARKILGPKAIIGATAKTNEQASEAIKAGCNYIGAGALFQTITHKHPVMIGMRGYLGVKNYVHQYFGNDIPVVAIGGINAKNIKEVLQNKPDGIGMVSAIIGSEDVQKTVERFSTLIRKHARDTKNIPRTSKFKI